MRRLGDSDRLIVRAPSWLGDFVMAEPALRALHRRLLVEGRGTLTLCAPAGWLELLGSALPGARRVGLERDARETPDAYRGHDVALFLNGSARSVRCALRAGVRARVSWARGGRALLLTDAVRPALERGRAPLGIGRRGRFPRALPRPFGSACAELAGWLGAPVHDTRARIVPSAEGRARAAAALRAAGVEAGERFVLVNVAARPDSAKAAPPGFWDALFDELALDLPVVAHAAPGEERVAFTHPRARRLAPAPELAELVALIEASSLYVTADGGPRHLAVALDRPLVVLFGPTDPRHTADHLGRTRAVRVELDCGPCHRERCPLEGAARHACMTRIEPAAAAEAAREALEAVGAPAALHPAGTRR